MGDVQESLVGVDDELKLIDDGFLSLHQYYQKLGKQKKESLPYTEGELLRAHDLHTQGATIWEIAKQLGRSPSSLSKQLKEIFGDAHTELVRKNYQNSGVQYRKNRWRRIESEMRVENRWRRVESEMRAERLANRKKAIVEIEHSQRITLRMNSKILRLRSKQRWIVTPDGKFSSMAAASEYYGATGVSIACRIRNLSGWYYEDESVPARNESHF